MNNTYKKNNDSTPSQRLKEQQWIGSNNNNINSNQKFNKKTNNNMDKNWIGQVLSNPNAINNKKIIQNKLETPKNINQINRQPINQNKFNSYSRKTTQSPLSKLSNPLSRMSEISTPQKSPMQLMNDIFRSIGMHHLSNSKTYYSRQSQDHLCELLSNKNKMNLYIKKLSNEMNQVPPQIQKNYQILLTLLHQLSQADLQIHQDQNGIKIWFNRAELVEKQKQVQRLERQLQEKNKQTQKIVEEYQGVIRNFNDVIQKLIQQKKY